jgi:transposase
LDGGQVNVARRRLEEWISWAKRSRLEAFKKLAQTIEKYIEGILAYVQTGISNGRVEGLNNKIRTITKRAYGFHSALSLIAYVFLCCTGIVIDPVRHLPARWT